MPTAAPPPPVPRLGRLLDLVALALAAGGAAVYLRAWAGLRALQALTGPSPTAGAAMAEFDRWWRLSRLGAWVFGLGVVVAVAAAIVARRARPAS